jgi:GH25 family lysozyme M1 (1,4-beta-N-acetylmuramidase)
MSKLRRVTILHAALAGGVAVTLSCVPALDASAAAASGSGPVRGLDISAYQHVGKPIDWQEIARQGARFVSVKATEGTYYRNPYYGSDTKAAKAAGLVVLPYVFANPAADAGAPTARYAVAVTGKHGPSGTPLVVDLENDPYKKKKDCYGVSKTETVKWIGGFLGTARKLTGRWPIIYTTAAWWNECTGGTTKFTHDPLWLAAFGASKPSVPSPWSRWAFWQYSDNGKLAGIGPVDLDYYQPTNGMPALTGSAHKAKAKAKAKK